MRSSASQSQSKMFCFLCMRAINRSRFGFKSWPLISLKCLSAAKRGPAFYLALFSLHVALVIGQPTDRQIDLLIHFMPTNSNHSTLYSQFNTTPIKP